METNDGIINNMIFPAPNPASYNLSTSNKFTKLVHIPRFPLCEGFAESLLTPGYIVGYYISSTFDKLKTKNDNDKGFDKNYYKECYFCSNSNESEPSHLVVYSHPNAIDIGGCVDELIYMSKYLNVDILAFEFTGYGMCGSDHLSISDKKYFYNIWKEKKERSKSEEEVEKDHFSFVDIEGDPKNINDTNCLVMPSEYQRPSERHFYRDIESVLVFVENELHIPLHQVILMGRSIGTGPVVQAAAFLPTCVNGGTFLKLQNLDLPAELIGDNTLTVDTSGNEQQKGCYSEDFVYPSSSLQEVLGNKGRKNSYFDKNIYRFPLAGVFLQCPFSSINDCIEAIISTRLPKVNSDNSSLVSSKNDDNEGNNGTRSNNNRLINFGNNIANKVIGKAGSYGIKVAKAIVADRFRNIDSIGKIFNIEGLRTEELQEEISIIDNEINSIVNNNDYGNTDKENVFKKLLTPPPVLIQHGADDCIVPIKNTEALVSEMNKAVIAIPDEPKKYVFFEPSPDCGHNDLILKEATDKLYNSILKPSRKKLNDARFALISMTSSDEGNKVESHKNKFCISFKKKYTRNSKIISSFRIVNLAYVVENILPRFVIFHRSYYHEIYCEQLLDNNSLSLIFANKLIHSISENNNIEDNNNMIKSKGYFSVKDARELSLIDSIKNNKFATTFENIFISPFIYDQVELKSLSKTADSKPNTDKLVFSSNNFFDSKLWEIIRQRNSLFNSNKRMTFGKWIKEVVPNSFARSFGTILCDLCGNSLKNENNYLSFYDYSFKKSPDFNNSLPKIVTSPSLQKELMMIFTTSLITFIQLTAFSWIRYIKSINSYNALAKEKKYQTLNLKNLSSQENINKFIKEQLILFGNPLAIYLLPIVRSKNYIKERKLGYTNNKDNIYISKQSSSSKLPCAGFHVLCFGSLLLDPGTDTNSVNNFSNDLNTYSIASPQLPPMLNPTLEYNYWLRDDITIPETMDSFEELIAFKQNKNNEIFNRICFPPFHFPRLTLVEFELPYSILQILEFVLKNIDFFNILNINADSNKKGCNPVNLFALKLAESYMFLSEDQVDRIQLACERLVLNLVQREEKKWKYEKDISKSNFKKEDIPLYEPYNITKPPISTLLIPFLQLLTVNPSDSGKEISLMASSQEIENNINKIEINKSKTTSSSILSDPEAKALLSNLLIGSSNLNCDKKSSDFSYYLLTPLFGPSKFTNTIGLRFSPKVLNFLSEEFTSDIYEIAFNNKNDNGKNLKDILKGFDTDCKALINLVKNTSNIYYNRIKTSDRDNAEYLMLKISAALFNCDMLDYISILTGMGQGTEIDKAKMCLNKLSKIFISYEADRWNNNFYNSALSKIDDNNKGVGEKNYNNISLPSLRFVVSVDGPSLAVDDMLIRPIRRVLEDELRWIIPSQSTTAASRGMSGIGPVKDCLIF